MDLYCQQRLRQFRGNLKDKTKAYLAGLLDSEGDLSITRHVSKERTYIVKGKSYTYSGYTSYGVSFAVYNTCLPVMKYLVHHFGGTFRMLKKATKDRQVMWSWSPEGSKHALKVLCEILPYILLRKNQAIVCEKFLKLEGQICPDLRRILYEEYEVIKSSSLTTETNHVFKWKKNLQNAYFSGVFDGEGTASVYKASSTVWIPGSNPNLLEAMSKIYKGNPVTSHNRKGAKPERFTEHRICIPVSNMEKFILQMLPYSIIKREQLLLTLENLRGVSLERRKQIKRKLFELKHPLKIKIQSDLIGDYESAPMGTLEA
jgi:hypothetical protein